MYFFQRIFEKLKRFRHTTFITSKQQMAYFDVQGLNASIFVEKTDTGVKVDGQEHELEGDKVFERGLHIYTLKTNVIELGKDYYPWRMGAVCFTVWSQNLNKPTEEWGYDETPTKLLIEDTVYDVENADCFWPLPTLRLDGEIVGVIDMSASMETGATTRTLKWIKV